MWVGCPLRYGTLYDGDQIFAEYEASDFTLCGIDCQGDLMCEGFSYLNGYCYLFSNIQHTEFKADAISGNESYFQHLFFFAQTVLNLSVMRMTNV